MLLTLSQLSFCYLQNEYANIYFKEPQENEGKKCKQTTLPSAWCPDLYDLYLDGQLFTKPCHSAHSESCIIMWPLLNMSFDHAQEIDCVPKCPSVYF